jgi:hypothetical protein
MRSIRFNQIQNKTLQATRFKADDKMQNIQLATQVFILLPAKADVYLQG